MRILTTIVLIFLVCFLSSCYILSEGAKYKFNDGIYYTDRFSHNEVYVYKVDEDTLAVFPVIEFKDSTAILTAQRVNYTAIKKKFKDNKINHTFYKPSFDVDVLTMPLKYRFASDAFPNQLTSNFNGAAYVGFRTDAYDVIYRRTPYNLYKQDVKHSGYSAGLFAGVGSSLVTGYTLRDSANIEYEGVVLITGLAVNAAVQNLTFGLALGFDHLMDKYRRQWIYEGKPFIGFTVGLNIN